MSCLKWQTAVWFARVHGGKTLHGWELVHDQPVTKPFDPYYIPVAEIRKIKDRQWQLIVTSEASCRYFPTLKAAKAMGIALYRMDNDE